MVTKDTVETDKGTVHLYWVDHTQQKKLGKTKWVRLEKVLEEMGPEIHSIAMEGPLREKRLERLVKRMENGKKISSSKDTQKIIERCIQKNMNLILIDSKTTGKSLASKERLTGRQVVESEEEKGVRLPEEFRTSTNFSNHFREVMMADNIMKTLGKHEEYKTREGPVEIAVIAHPSHSINIKEYLRHPEKLRTVKKAVLKATGGKFEEHRWKEPLFLRPEHLKKSRWERLKEKVRK